MDFTERLPLEHGFAAVFHDRIRPGLLQMEEERKARLRRARLHAALALVFGPGLGLAIFLGMGEGFGTFLAVAVAILGLIAAFVLWNIQSSAWKGKVEDLVMPVVCDHVGDLEYSSDGPAGFPVAQMRALRMLPNYDTVALSHDMRGTHHGTDFELVHARLATETRDSNGDSKTRTVFSGLLFRIEVPVEAPTPILIARDWGVVGNKLGTLFSGGKRAGMPKVAFDHPAFEAAFEVHANDPQAARDFMPNAFLDNLLTIGEESGRRGAKSMTAAFTGRTFYLALERSGQFMQLGSLTRPVTDMEDDLHGIFADIALVHRIIDRLHGV